MSTTPDEPAPRLRRVDPEVVDRDPFWSVVRRRHPDVDLVLLPPPHPPSSATVGSVPLEVVEKSVQVARDTWRSLAPFLELGGQPGDQPGAEEPAVRWRRRGERFALVMEKALPGIDPDVGVGLLRSLSDHFGAGGWSVVATRRGGHPALEVAHGLVDVLVVVGPGATTVAVATGLMAVAPADRTTLLEAARRWP